MSRAHVAGTTAFLAFAFMGLACFFAAERTITKIVLFLAMGLAGGIVSGLIFRLLATPEERRRDLEDRVRNND